MENKTQKDWKLRLPDWQTVEPIMRWQERALKFDLIGLSEMMMQIIEAWPYPGNPRDPRSYRELTIDQWKEAARRVGDAIGTFFFVEAGRDQQGGLPGGAAAQGAKPAVDDRAD